MASDQDWNPAGTTTTRDPSGPPGPGIGAHGPGSPAAGSHLNPAFLALLPGGLVLLALWLGRSEEEIVVWAMAHGLVDESRTAAALDAVHRTSRVLLGTGIGLFAPLAFRAALLLRDRPPGRWLRRVATYVGRSFSPVTSAARACALHVSTRVVRAASATASVAVLTGRWGLLAGALVARWASAGVRAAARRGAALLRRMISILHPAWVRALGAATQIMRLLGAAGDAAANRAARLWRRVRTAASVGGRLAWAALRLSTRVVRAAHATASVAVLTGRRGLLAGALVARWASKGVRAAARRCAALLRRMVSALRPAWVRAQGVAAQIMRLLGAAGDAAANRAARLWRRVRTAASAGGRLTWAALRFILRQAADSSRRLSLAISRAAWAVLVVTAHSSAVPVAAAARATRAAAVSCLGVAVRTWTATVRIAGRCSHPIAGVVRSAGSRAADAGRALATFAVQALQAGFGAVGTMAAALGRLFINTAARCVGWLELAVDTCEHRLGRVLVACKHGLARGRDLAARATTAVAVAAARWGGRVRREAARLSHGAARGTTAACRALLHALKFAMHPVRILALSTAARFAGALGTTWRACASPAKASWRLACRASAIFLRRTLNVVQPIVHRAAGLGRAGSQALLGGLVALTRLTAACAVAVGRSAAAAAAAAAATTASVAVTLAVVAWSPLRFAAGRLTRATAALAGFMERTAFALGTRIAALGRSLVAPVAAAVSAVARTAASAAEWALKATVSMVATFEFLAIAALRPLVRQAARGCSALRSVLARIARASASLGAGLVDTGLRAGSRAFAAARSIAAALHSVPAHLVDWVAGSLHTGVRNTGRGCRRVYHSPAGPALMLCGGTAAVFGALFFAGSVARPEPTVTVVHWSTGHLLRDGSGLRLLRQMADEFNAAGYHTDDGKRMKVEVYYQGGAEQASELIARVTGSGPLDRDLPNPTLVTPSASHWLVNVNYAAGQEVVDLQDTASRSLARAYVGIVTYEEMARCLGWPDREIGYADIIALSEDPAGWSRYGCARAEWGQRPLLAFTDPTTSDTGRAVLLVLYAIAAGKAPEDLVDDDVTNPAVVDYVRRFQSLVDHYMIGTIPLNTKIYQGPRFGHFFIMPEDNLVHLYEGTEKASVHGVATKAPPLADVGRRMVMIYPEEGSIVRDNCACVVRADWVSREQEAAAEMWVQFLREPAQQRSFMEAGFRPGTGLEAAGPISAAYGLNPELPAKVFNVEQVPPHVAAAIDGSWGTVKRPAIVAFVVDNSGSMLGDKLRQAKQGLERAMEAIAPNSQIGLVLFNDTVRATLDVAPVAEKRAAILTAVDRMHAEGETALYEAIAEGIALADEASEPAEGSGRGDAIRAVVVLTDGRANRGAVRLDDLVEMMSTNELAVSEFDGMDGSAAREAGGRTVAGSLVIGQRLALPTKHDVQVFFVAIGEDADLEIGRILAEATGAEFQGAAEDDLAEVLEEISKYF